MDLFENLGDKVKTTAKIVGEKSADMVELGKLRIQIANLENESRRAKTEIGQIFYNAYSNGEEIPNERILELCQEIKEKDLEIEVIKYKIDNIKI